MNVIRTDRPAPPDTSIRRATSLHGRPHSESVSAAEIVIAVTIAVLLVCGVLATAAAPQVHSAGVRTVRVEPGQTLWSIARANPMPGLTTQQTADLIARANGLAGNSVAAHSSLRVPVAFLEKLMASR